MGFLKSGHIYEILADMERGMLDMLPFDLRCKSVAVNSKSIEMIRISVAYFEVSYTRDN